MENREKPSFSSRRQSIVGLYIVLPFLVFVLTGLDPLKAGNILAYISLVLFGVLLMLHFVRSVPRDITACLWTLLVLLLVGATGWFFSPFFFLLYFVAVALGFLYTAGTAIGFTLSLITLFLAYVNVKEDFAILISLPLVLPLVVILRRSFLLVQQEKKGILILEEDRHAGITSLDTVLSNRVNQIGVLLRQPITYIKQGLALIDDNKVTSEEAHDLTKRMRRSAEEIFTLVKEFERGTTKNELLTASRTQADEPTSSPPSHPLSS